MKSILDSDNYKFFNIVICDKSFKTFDYRLFLQFFEIFKQLYLYRKS